MGDTALKNQLLRRLDDLSPYQQGQVLDFVDHITSGRRGVSSEELRSFSGVIDDESAREMKAAIEEGCERIDANEW